MFGIGSTELLVILLVALIVLGPKSMASVSRALGKAIGEFRRVSTDFQRALNVESAEEEAREAAEKRREQAAARAGQQPAGETGAAGTAKNVSAGHENEVSGGERMPGADDGFSAGQKEAIRNMAMPPEDSPLAQALAKAKNEAGAASANKANETRRAEADRAGTARVECNHGA